MSENVSQLANRAGCDPSFKLLMRVWKAELDECWSLLRKYVTEVCACSYSQGQITHKTWPEIADGCSSDLLVFDWLTGARLAGWLAGWLMLVWLTVASYVWCWLDWLIVAGVCSCVVAPVIRSV